MAWTRKILRTWSALSVALVVYAAAPHVHLDTVQARPGPWVTAGSSANHAHTSDHTSDHTPDQTAAPTARETAGGDRLAGGTNDLTRDDAHESHSQTAATDDHPCTLCRDRESRELATPARTLLEETPAKTLQVDVQSAPTRTELLLARRHPARGPPLAC